MPGFGSMAACDVSRDKALSLARWPLSIAYTSRTHTYTPICIPQLTVNSLLQLPRKTGNLFWQLFECFYLNMAHQSEQRWLKLFSCRLPLLLPLLLLLSLSLLLQVAEAKRTSGEYLVEHIDWQDEGTHKTECNDLLRCMNTL